MAGRTIAIGDIHGCSDALRALLTEVNPQSDDTIITLGDYVDRGPDSADVIEQMVELVSRCNLIPLLGNHELMMLQAVRDEGEMSFWQGNGGDATIASYGGDIRNVPQHHRMFFQHCVQFHETETQMFVHANYVYDLQLHEQPESILFWEHILEDPPPPHISGKRVFVGHTPQQDGMVRDLGHVVLLDTFCFGGKNLSAMDVDAEHVWQADNHGNLHFYDNAREH